MIEFERPEGLPAKAADVIFSPALLAVVEWCSLRSLRLETGLSWLTEQAFGSPNQSIFWWVGPDFISATSGLNKLKSMLSPDFFMQARKTLSLNIINGTTIRFLSADNLSSLVSDSVSAILIDQAIHVGDKAWKILQDTVAESAAKIRIISTVGSKASWFNLVARKAETGFQGWQQTKFTASDAASAALIDESEITLAKESLPVHLFRAFYLCEPHDDRIDPSSQKSNPKLMSDVELALIAGVETSPDGCYKGRRALDNRI